LHGATLGAERGFGWRTEIENIPVWPLGLLATLQTFISFLRIATLDFDVSVAKDYPKVE
jgi:hypothetical protein